MPSLNPPDGYLITDPTNITWGTHIDRDETSSELGGNAIDFLAVAAASDPELESDFFPIEGGVNHIIEARAQASGVAGGQNLRLQYQIYDAAKANLGNFTLHNAPLTAAATYESIGGIVTGNPNQRFAKVRFNKTASAAFDAQYDCVVVKPNPTGYLVNRLSTTQAIPASTWTTIIYNATSAVGSNLARMSFNPTTGVVTALRPGFYHIAAGVTITDPDSNLETFGIRLTRNGDVNGTRRGDFSEIGQATVDQPRTRCVAGTMLLDIGDTIEAEIYTSFASTVLDAVENTYMDIHKIDAI